jgi:hypothetical protein
LESLVANTKTPREERVINGRVGGIKSQTLEYQAERLVKNWPALSPEQQSKIAQTLRPVVGKTP